MGYMGSYQEIMKPLILLQYRSYMEIRLLNGLKLLGLHGVKSIPLLE